ncbi:MAG: VWA domain-containing protein [Bdellovibrionales bacterium]|nr:VWA domain-containing protein [Bdellovibrionales bacterium]
MNSFLLLGLIFLESLPNSCYAEEGPLSSRVVIVLDASGSMWGQIEGEAKIGIAKRVVGELVRGLDSSVELGLTVYGHRSKGDCNDIESLVPVGKVEPQSFLKTVEGISPKGMTPLSQAVIHAAEELRYSEQKATVVLVSDGIETCNLDPCKVAEELERAGVDFTAHVIGFDVSDPAAKAQLSCLAEKTGGKFLSASDAASLKSSLETVVAEAVEVSQPVVLENVELVAVHAPGEQPLEQVYWKVFQLNSAGEDQGGPIEQGGGSSPKYHLEPGRYRAEVESLNGKARAEKRFEVSTDQTSREEVVLAEEGVIAPVAVHSPGGEPITDGLYWKVFPMESEGAIEESKAVTYGGGSTPEYQLLPGKYRATVESTNGKAKAEQIVEVVAGKRVSAEVVLPLEGKVKLVAVTETGGKALTDMYWNIYEVGSGIEERGAKVTYGGGASPEYLLLPGKYLASVESVNGKATAEQVIEVEGGKTKTVEVIIAQEGVIQLRAVTEAGGKPLQRVYWNLFTVVPADSMEEAVKVTYGGGDTPEYRLLPGTYKAVGESVNGMAKVEQEVTVSAGKKQVVDVLFPAEGEVELVAVEQAGGSPLRGGYFEVKTIVPADSLETPTTVQRGGGNPKFRMLPGKYIAQVKFQKNTFESEIEVLPGKRLRHEIVVTGEKS